MTVDVAAIGRVLAAARARNAEALLETEGVEVLRALGIRTPQSVFVTGSAGVPSVERPAGSLVVVKVISREILHKSDVGGVLVVPNDDEAVVSAIATMERKFSGQRVDGFTINEFIEYDRSVGSELLLGLRWTADFGPVVTFGPGGIYTEFLAANFRPGRDVAIVSAHETDEDAIGRAIERAAVTTLITGRLRGQPPRVTLDAIVPVVRRFMALATRFMPEGISECEINPLVVTSRGLIALDILVKLGRPAEPARPARPVQKFRNLLEPRSAAIIGVSEKMNPGRIILRNLLREGFDRDRIAVVKPGTDEIDGCRCYPTISALPGKVDLFILAVAAAQAPEAVAEIIEGQKAESLIVIPGGLEEKQGSEALVARMRAALADARGSAWGGPLINGGNCLGIRSKPGRYDTMFIPETKLPLPTSATAPVAIVSQSGAFAVSRMSKLSSLNPKYSISIGNQMDLTIGDYLTWLKDDPDIQVFAVYVEGFVAGDGLRFVEAARDITASGRTVILYRAGRTAAGAKASASHTASIAGDYAVTRELAGAAGVIVADSLADFEDLTRLFTRLRDKTVGGHGLGAVSNAGFECVAIGDNLGDLHLADFTATTGARLLEVFRQTRIDSVVDVHNPIDLTPMAGDEAFDLVVRAVLADANVQVALVGCVPLTPALNTLERGDAHHDDLRRPDSIVSRLVRIAAETMKPWVAVVDAGAVYDPMARLLEEGGVPTFREADRALRLFNVFCRARLSKGAAMV